MSDGGRVQVRIASDGLTAEVAVVAGAAADAPAVHAALQTAGVTLGVDEASCMRLGAQLGDEQFCSSGEVVARGVLPTKPEEARLELLFYPCTADARQTANGALLWRRQQRQSG